MKELATLGLKPTEHGLVWNSIKNSGYKWRDGRWTKGVSKLTTDRFVSEKIISVDWDFSPKATIELITDIEAQYLAIEGLEREKQFQGNSQHKEWIEAWVALQKLRFSEVDEVIWEGLKHTVDENGQSLCVCKTGRGNEYRIVGKTPEEIIDWMAGMTVNGSTQTRLGYIESMIVERIMEYSMGHYGEETTPIEILDGSILSAAAAGDLYTHAPVTTQDGIFCGYRLRQKEKITALKYIKASLESFFARIQYRIREIKTMANYPNEPCYLFIPFDGQEGDWSVWDAWMQESFAKPSAKQAFMGWIGALLDAENTGKQALWLHGRGNDGKSKVADALCDYFGNAAVALSGKSMTNQFGAAKLENKRLVIVADAKNQKLLQSEWAHNLTGGDRTDSERKGKNSYSTKLSGNLMVFANNPPEIKSDEANQVARLLYIRMRQRTLEELIAKGLAVMDADGETHFVGSSDWPKLLKQQLPAFLTACFEVYQDVAPTRSDIMTSRELKVDTESMCSDPVSDNIAALCERTFELDESDDEESMIERAAAFAALRAGQKEFGVNVDSTFTISEINSYLYNHFGAERIRKRVNSVSKAFLSRIKLRENLEDQGL